MTGKYRKIFIRILIITAVIWALGVILLDIAAPNLHYRFRDPNEPVIPGHGGGWMLLGSPLCVLVVIASFFILRFLSGKHRDDGS